MPRSLLAIAVLTLSALVPLAPAQSDPLAGFDDPVGDLNALLPRASDDRRADLILGRVLSETEPVPDAIEALDSISLLVPGDGEWDAALAWASGEKQKAALEAFVEATDRRADNVFALPYGEAAPADLRAAGFSVDLPDGKVYAATPTYVDLLERLDALVWIEANRLAEAGEGMEAAELLASMVRLGRMLADRPMLFESMIGYYVMLESCERLRDLVYRHRDLLNERDTKRIGRLLEERTLRLDRLGFPRGGEIAVKQAIIDGFERMGALERGKAMGVMRGVIRAWGGEEDDEAFVADTLDFDDDSEKVLSTVHSNYFESIDTASRVFADWRLRWPLDPYDVVMKRPSYFAQLSAEPARHFLIQLVTMPHDVLFDTRKRLRSSLSGTRLALGVVAYSNDFGAWPKPLVAIRPAYAREIDVDPFDPNKADQMRYFVPMRDQSWSSTERPHPHTITLHSEIETNEISGVFGADYLGVIPDAEAVTSARAMFGAMTSLGLEPRNVVEFISEMEMAPLDRLVPEHLKSDVEGLGVEAMRIFATTMAETAIAHPDYAELREAFFMAPAGEGRRGRSRRNRREESVSRELTAASRSLAVAQSRVGGPLARRLQREMAGGDEIAVFSVELDDEAFVLYSVGEDGVADWAEQSGLDGTDILYWPPVLSLYREHTGG